MATEFSSISTGDVSVTITPGVAGILQVFVDGDKIYDKKEEDNQTPHLNRVKELKAIVKDRLGVAVAADD